jgi:outer membrane protein assembly factor BamB
MDSPLGDGLHINSSPTVANGVVYIGSDDHNLYAFDAKTGTILWTYATGDKVNSSPAVANGVIYISSEDGNLYAFHLPI